MTGPIYRVDYHDPEQDAWLPVDSRVTAHPATFATRKSADDAARAAARDEPADRVRVTQGSRTVTEYEVRPDGSLRRLATTS